MNRLGTPKDFWPIAVIALFTTISVAGLSMYQIKEDSSQGHVNVSNCDGHSTGTTFSPNFPEPTVSGTVETKQSNHKCQLCTVFKKMLFLSTIIMPKF